MKADYLLRTNSIGKAPLPQMIARALRMLAVTALVVAWPFTGSAQTLDRLRTGLAQSPELSPVRPSRCLPEGRRSRDPGRCCSHSTSGNICCGETHGSCANSGCCDPAGDTPFCHQGSCVSCLPEGAQGDAASCCTHAAANGVCCGEEFGTCATSGCCAETNILYCHESVCVPCLPEGAPGDEDSCCSGATTDSGACCGEVGASCASSGCCAAGAACDAALICQPCLEEGTAATDPVECCSGTAENGVCCGLLNETCANSGCCILGVCSDGACIACLPEGEGTGDQEICCSHEAVGGICCGEENGFCLDSGCCVGGAELLPVPLFRLHPCWRGVYVAIGLLRGGLLQRNLYSNRF